jgi:hypothetical protein
VKVMILGASVNAAATTSSIVSHGDAGCKRSLSAVTQAGAPWPEGPPQRYERASPGAAHA